jgi:hypothetical protein
MITKQANALLGGITGALASAHLTPSEVQILADAYDTKPNKKALVAENIARGALGGVTGAVAGRLAARVAKLPKYQIPFVLGGTMIGSNMAANKYSRTNAAAFRLREIEDQLRKQKDT